MAYGGWSVVEHHLTPGDVVMFVAYLDRLYDPIDSLTALARTLQEHTTSLRRALRLMAQGDVEPRGVALVAGPGRIEVRDLHFAYMPEQEVLHGVSFTLEPGRVTALVGPSGAGKTTIADLLLRLREPDAGLILVDGQPLKDLDPASVRQVVAMVAAEIKTALATMRGQRTTLVIAHRYAMVADADHVIVLEDGRVAVQGTPGQVQAENPWFAAFAASGAGATATTRERSA